MTDNSAVEQITKQLEAQGIDTSDNKSVPMGRNTKANTEPRVVEEPVQQEEQSSEPVSEEIDVVAEATKQGWKPGGSKSAEEFLRAGDLYKEISSRGKALKEKNKEIAELQETLAELKQFMNGQKEIGYKQALADLYRQRAQAIADGDIETVNTAEEAIKNTTQEYQSVIKPTLPREAEDFYQQHKTWIEDKTPKTAHLRAYAQRVNESLATMQLSPAEHVAALEDELKRAFPDRFGAKVEQVEQSFVASDTPSGRTPAKKTKYSFSDLTDTQKTCCKHFVKHGIMKEDDYIKSLVESGVLK
jgi:hypothetical protein